MKALFKAGVAVLVAMASSSVYAGGYLEGRFVSTALEAEDGVDKFEAESTGFEFRGSADLSDRAGVRFSYVAVDGDEVEVNGDSFDLDFTLKLLRVGPTVNFTEVGGNAHFYGVAEYVRFTSGAEGENDTESGFDVGIGFKDAGKTGFLWDAELGYLKVKDAKGVFLQGSLGYRFNSTFALLAGVQSYATEDDDNIEEVYANATLGARISF